MTNKEKVPCAICQAGRVDDKDTMKLGRHTYHICEDCKGLLEIHAMSMRMQFDNERNNVVIESYNKNIDAVIKEWAKNPPRIERELGEYKKMKLKETSNERKKEKV